MAAEGEARELPDLLQPLANFIGRIPSVLWVSGGSSEGDDEDGWWWVKFQIEVAHPCAWLVVQQFAHVVNDLSINTRLPAVFYPVSPPVLANGGPAEFLSWVIEVTNPPFDPNEIIRHATPYFPKDIADPEEWVALVAAAEADDQKES
jgi:hypothetical protein